jgi:uncharacterized DUF497 family protein
MSLPLLHFEWDEANRSHLARHGVTPREAEEVVLNDPLDTELQNGDETSGEERLLHLGETATGRILQLVATWRNGGVRVISAWDAPKQVKTYYLAEMGRRHGNIEDSQI